MQTLRGKLRSTALFLRFEYLTFALILPILGAASVLQSFSASHVLWLFGITFSLHIFISLQNDLVDLPLDRTDPRRQDSPLVKGTVSPGLATAVVLLQVPIVIAACIWWGAKPLLFLSISLVFGMMTVYNLWGKRAQNPLITDLVQGFGFGGITLIGAASSGSPTVFTAAAFVGVVLWMMLTNLMGGIRDLQSDQAYHLMTTAIFLGSRYEKGKFHLSERNKKYSSFLLMLLFVTPALFLWGRISSLDIAIFSTVSLAMLLAWVAASAALRSFFMVVSREYRVEMDLALIVMYLAALPMMAIVALNGNYWIGWPAIVVILGTVRKYSILRVIGTETATT